MAARSSGGGRVCVGRIGAAHGTRGEVRLKSFTADPMAVMNYGSLETEDGTATFEIESLREQMFASHPGQAPFYCVAFHPALPRDLLDANRAVRFIRRSPDPTLQLVRASILVRVRGDGGGGSRYVDTSLLSLEQAMALLSPASLAERIGEANLATLQREGPDRLELLLSSLRG